jgi:DNA-directed RNA polymerase subunit RPC12/RpoP
MNHAIREVTICECGGSWYRGDHFQKKLTWAKKYYCPRCHSKRATQEKVSVLKAVPHEVLQILIDRQFIKENLVTDIVWR